MTLGKLALALGILVDDAEEVIVVACPRSSI
jgi:hypothetical protein